MKVAIVCVLVVISSVSCGAQRGDSNLPRTVRVVPSERAFRIVATDAGFEAPTAVPAGLRHIVFENRGSEIHEAMLVKLAKDMSADDYVAAVKAGSDFPKGALDYSGAGLTSPGEATELWLKVDPGQYIIICWNNGHATSVPVHRFSVLANEVNDQPPKEDLILKLLDYHFELEGAFKRGQQVIRVETQGPSMHEADLFLLKDGKSVDELKSWCKKENGPPPARALGGILDSHDITRVVWLRKNLSPGRYVLHCEMPMPGHLTHADFGMVREIDITQ